MIEQLVEKVAAWCEKHDRIEYITGSGGRTDIYMIRYFVVKSKWCNLYIHRFMRSDRDDLHDHPWNFATYLVRGAYTEKKWDAKSKSIVTTRRIVKDCGKYTKNRFVFRRATDQHQVVTDRALQLVDKAQAPLTVCLTGPKIREWGFIKNEPLSVTERMARQLEADLYAFEGPILKTKRVWIPYQLYFEENK